MIFPLGLPLNCTWCFSPPLIPLIQEGLLAQVAGYSVDLTIGNSWLLAHSLPCSGASLICFYFDSYFFNSISKGYEQGSE